MEDSIRPSQVVQDNLGWAPVRSTDPPERVEFESLCKKWARFKQDLLTEYFARRPEAPPPPFAHAPPSEIHSDDLSRSEDESSLQEQASRHSAPSVLEELKPLSSLLPQQRISRVLRVFVAWKT